MGDSNSKKSDRPDLGDEDGLRERIAEAIVAGGGVSAMVEKTGIPLGTLSKYTAKTSTASFTNAAKIAAAAGVNLDRIAFGRVPLAATAHLRRVVERIAPPFGTTSGLVQLPLFNIEASAGLGVPVGPEARLGAVAFDPVFLRAQGARPDQCSIIAASGDSMQPVIPDGSLLVVDHSQKEVRNGHIMVVNVGEDLLVKRIRRRMDGLIELISDNPAYAPETLGPDALAQLRVVGRVVYFCRVP
jgi:phage repressor protein C with HTH and peptisase S24 domain